MNNPFTLKGKNIVITGASSGIGRQCAISCSEAGANIVIMGRNSERLQETLAKLSFGNHFVISADITCYENLESHISGVVSKIGKISGFIHSAGEELTMPLQTMNAIHYEKLFSINVIAGFELAKILSKKKYLDEKTGASFVFISSVMSINGQAGIIAYCSSKGALVAGAKAMALELAYKNIRVNCVSPGYVETEIVNKLFTNLPERSVEVIKNMHPLKLGKPTDVAFSCIYLLSDAARWVTGTNLIVDGGYSIQ